MEPATRASNADIYAAVQVVQTDIAALVIEQRHTREAVSELATQMRALNNSVRTNAQAIATEAEWRGGHERAHTARNDTVDSTLDSLRARTDVIGVLNAGLTALLALAATIIARVLP